MQKLAFSMRNAQMGQLQLFRTQAQVDAVQRDIKVLHECGVPYEPLTRNQLARVEPAFAQARDRLTGGLRLRLYSATRTMRSLLIAYRFEEQLRIGHQAKSWKKLCNIGRSLLQLALPMNRLGDGPCTKHCVQGEVRHLFS